MAWRIKTVAERIGVPRNTLIAWERRLGILDPVRTDGGYRLYSDADVELLRELKVRIEQGLKVSEAWASIQRERGEGEVVEPRVATEARAAAEPEPRRAAASATADPSQGSMPALEGLWRQILGYLVAYDRPEADRLAWELLTVPFELQLDRVYFPMLREVGEGWMAGRYSIAEEHFVSGWCRERMTAMLSNVQTHRPGAAEITCATPAGEQHELGLLGLAVRLGLRGFRVSWLGSGVPVLDLVAHVQARHPWAVAISLVHQRPESEVRYWLSDLRRRLPAETHLVVGGAAVAGLPADAVPGVVLCAEELPPLLHQPPQR
jgi:DNA-binding transcriptional MerR regulator/methylmalonyl-CoA mutase cobalamin-binding subunit